MNSHAAELPMMFLKPSELFFFRKGYELPARVITVLGSCVSVIFFSPRLRMSAICHALLPRYVGGGKREEPEKREPFKYVRSVVPIMVAKFRQQGLRPSEIDVRLFGGADMFGHHAWGGRLPSVGTQNIDMAEKMIRSAGLRVRNAEVGGCFGRKIFFYPHTGEIRVRNLERSERRL